MATDEFSGNPATEWLTEAGPDRRMKLLADFWYDDPDGRRWLAPRDATVDGASIPAPLWSIVGSPYTGDYRRASIVHDLACDDPAVDRREADRMFYRACLAGGCPVDEAQLLYAGVRIGAWLPRVRLWSMDAAEPSLRRGAVGTPLLDESIRATFREIAHDLGVRSVPDFNALEAVVDQHLEAKARQ